MAVDRYSRFVTLLKVALPLTAIALLSTLFLLSRNIDPVATIPFAESEIRERLQDQVVTSPVFAGLNATGDQLTVRAQEMRNASPETQLAEAVRARFTLTDGTILSMNAGHGDVNSRDKQADLSKGVEFTSSNGTRFQTDMMSAQLEPLTIEAPNPVAGESPFGTLNAGSMHLHTDPTTGARQLIFTNGVKLLYQPKPLAD